MICPDCGTDNQDSAERCTSCGHALALPMGTVLANRYEIKSLLGMGGLGRVYRAHDRMLDEAVAVKVLHPEAARSPELSKRFRSEIKLARKVRHKNVCAIHEYGEHEGYRFVAMELVDGIDLHRVLRESGPLPPKEAFEVAIQMTKGLAAIHGAGVLHRDLKTPNIMRDAHGHVRLLDFGIAKRLTPTGTLAVTAAQKVVGTPEYMSPEQIRGDDLDERSDIYGLGVVIYEIFTGTVPFQGKTPIDTLVKHMNTPPPLYGEAVAHLPPSIVGVLRRCLAKRAEERYASARELLGALRGARVATFPETAEAPPQTLETPPQEGGRVAPRSAPPPPTPPTLPPVQAAEPPAPAASMPVRPITMSTPPIGPPRNPRPGAPPLPSERRTTGEVATSEPDTVLVALLDPQPAAPVAPAPPERNRARLRGGYGAGLALLGLLAVVGARLWKGQERGRTPQETPPPTNVAGSVAAEVVKEIPPSPEPKAEVSAPPLLEAPAPAVTLAPAPTALPRAAARSEPASKRRRLAPIPTPSPMLQATPPPAPTTGTLYLEVKPAAQVEIDGQPAGSSPLASRELLAGKRVLRLNHPDYWPITRLVAVEPGRAVRLDLDLSWEAVPRARSKEPPYVVALEDSPSDPYFERGLKQMSEGDFQEAILTLEPVARRLQVAGKSKELARAEFYIGVALLELNRQGQAKERFQRALQNDFTLKVPAGFSPKVTSFFGTLRETIRKKP
jgi:serine/threonine protein kinase